MFENSDDFQFTPSMSQHLSNLFSNTDEINDSDHNLCYTAPKQPRPIPRTLDIPKNNLQPKPSNSTVICASTINLWKLENHKYNSLGHYGIALIGSSNLNSYEIILYQKKDNITSRTKIQEGFTLTHQNDFISYYDSNKQNWLMKFNNNGDKTTFTSQVEKCGGKNVFNESKKVEVKETNSIEKPKLLSDNDLNGLNDFNSDSSGSKTRANILSRMAKMGQSILPQTKPNSDISDTDEDETELKKDLPKKLKQKMKKPQNKILTRTSPVVENNQTTMPIGNMNIVQVPQQISPTSSIIQTSVIYDPLNLMVTENRTHNSEVRMNLNQISSKLDNVMRMIEATNNSEPKSNSNNEDLLKSKLKALELQSENLTTEMKRYEEKYRNLQEKFNEQEKILKNSEDKLKNSEEIIKKQTEQLSKIDLENTINKELESYKKIIEELEKKNENQSIKLKDLEEFYEENKDAPEMKNLINELNETIVQLKMKENCGNISDTEWIDEEMKKTDRFVEALKRTMNIVYNTTVEQFKENQEYSSVEINNIVAKYVKIATFKIIEDFKAIYTKSSAINEDD